MGVGYLLLLRLLLVCVCVCDVGSGVVCVMCVFVRRLALVLICLLYVCVLAGHVCCVVGMMVGGDDAAWTAGSGRCAVGRWSGDALQAVRI